MTFKIGDKVLLKKWGLWGTIIKTEPMGSFDKGNTGFHVSYRVGDYYTWTVVNIDDANNYLQLDTLTYLRRLKNKEE